MPSTPQSRMDREVITDPVRAVEGRIREHQMAAIRLKRARNALLNVFTLPPEVLSEIFQWNVIPEGDFGGLNRRSHNFVLVCHHWFEVASRTPDLWSFWGNTLMDWDRRCHRPGTAPLDLVLGDLEYDDDDLNPTIRDALQDRATRDSIRRVHLTAAYSGLLNSIIASLTPSYEERRSNRIESFILWNEGDTPVDVSDFFARHRFPKLRRLDLSDCKISSWDHLTSRTSILTTLVLDFSPPSPTPATSQLLSILISNPALRRLGLLGCALPDEVGGESSFQVRLHHLKELKLRGSLRCAFRLLHQLDHPRNMDNLSLTLYDSHITDIPQTIGPYLRAHLQRRDRPQNGLNLRISSKHYPAVFTGGRIELRVGDAGGINFSAPEWEEMNTFVTISMVLNGVFGKSVLQAAALDLIAYAPLEQVDYFHTFCNPAVTHIQFPNLRALSFHTTSLHAAFPDPNLIVDGNIFPSLEHVSLDCLSENGGDWSPLVAFLACRASFGNRLDTLVISGYPHVCPEVVERIRGMVRELKADQLSQVCYFGTCQGQ